MKPAVVAARSSRPSLVLSALLSGLWLALAVSLDAQNLYAVQRVVDGDTVVLAEVGPVRLIGVDTPETKDPRKPVQYYGVEASAFVQSMLSGQSVRVEYDHQRHDKYQRTLAYLFLSDGTFVNREIIRQGFGHAYVTYPFTYAADFRAAEREAREAERGLWGQAPAKASSVEPSRVWVNTSSRVYHCPGTRYYGNTARGEYPVRGRGRSAGPPARGRPAVWRGRRGIAADGGDERTGDVRRGVGAGRPGLGQHELARLSLSGHAVLRHDEARRGARTARRTNARVSTGWGTCMFVASSAPLSGCRARVQMKGAR